MLYCLLWFEAVPCIGFPWLHALPANQSAQICVWYSAVGVGGLSLFHFTPMVIWSSVRTDGKVAAHLSGSGPQVDTHLSPNTLTKDLFCGYPVWNQLRSYKSSTSSDSRLSSYSANFMLACVFAVSLVATLNMMPFVKVDFLCLEHRLSFYTREGHDFMLKCFIHFFLVLENCMYNIFNIRSNMSVWDHTHAVVESTMTSGHTYSVDITHAIWNTPKWYTHTVHHDCVLFKIKLKMSF